MGAILAANQQLVRGIWAALDLTVPDPARPETVMLSGGVVVVGGGDIVVGTYGCNTMANTDNGVRPYVNGNPVGSSFVASGTGQFGGLQTLTVEDGDLIQMWGWTDGVASNRRFFYGDGTKDLTYMTIDPP